jgi:hypothetical protein
LKHARLSALNKVEKAEKAAKLTKKKGNKHIMMLTKAQQDHEAASREFVSKEMETVRIFDRVEYEGQDAPGWMLELIAEWSNEIGESKTESLRSDVELEWNPDSKPNEHHSRNDPSLFRSSKLVSASTSVFEMQQKSSSQNFSEVPMIRRLSHWFRSRNCHPEIYQVRKDLDGYRYTLETAIADKKNKVRADRETEPGAGGATGVLGSPLRVWNISGRS